MWVQAVHLRMNTLLPHYFRYEVERPMGSLRTGARAGQGRPAGELGSKTQDHGGMLGPGRLQNTLMSGTSHETANGRETIFFDHHKTTLYEKVA